MLPRDAALTTLILGFFSIGWFSWTGSDLPANLESVAFVGSLLGILVTIAGAVLAFRNRSAGSSLSSRQAMSSYNTIVGIEIGAALVGVVILVVVGQTSYIAPWVCAVVGLHFWPMAGLLRDDGFKVLGALMVAVALVALITQPLTSLAPNTVTGLGAGTLFVVFAVRSALLARSGKNLELSMMMRNRKDRL